MLGRINDRLFTRSTTHSILVPPRAAPSMPRPRPPFSRSGRIDMPLQENPLRHPRRSAVSQYVAHTLSLLVLCLQLLLPKLNLTRKTKKMSLDTRVEKLTAEAMMAALHADAPTNALIRKSGFRHAYLITSFALTLALLPLWSIRYAHPSWRPRRSWTLGMALRVRAKRQICALVGALEVDTLGRDLSVDLDPKDLKYSYPITLPPVSEALLRGHPAEMLAMLRESAARGSWVPHFVHRPNKADPSSWKAEWVATQSTDYGPAPVKAFWYAGAKATPETALPPLQPGEPVGLYFHGGGYLCGTAAETDTIASIPKHVVSGSHVKRILSVDYRLAPQGPWPLPLIDAISSYAYLLSLGVKSSEIVVFGDSAGGHLAMALTRWLRDDGKEVDMGMPRGLVLMSPWCDLGFTNAWGEGRTYNVQSDLIDDTFGPFACGLLMRALPASLLYDSQYLSPSSLLLAPSSEGVDSMADFPPTCIIYGGAERLSKSILELWSRLQLARKSDSVGPTGDTLWEAQDCVHDFMIFPWQAKAAEVAHVQLDKWLGMLLDPACATEQLGVEVDPENSPVLVPSWSSLAESMDNGLSLGESALDEEIGSSPQTTIIAPMPSQAPPRGLARRLSKTPRKATKKMTTAEGSTPWLDFKKPFHVFGSDEETLVDDESDSGDSTGTLAEAALMEKADVSVRA